MSEQGTARLEFDGRQADRPNAPARCGHTIPPLTLEW